MRSRGTIPVGLSAAGLLAAHGLDYLLAVPDRTQRLAYLASTGHAYLSVVSAAVVVLAVTSSLTSLFMRSGQARFARTALSCGLAQTIGFLALESTERIIAGTSPQLPARLLWTGVALQLVFGVLAACVAGLVRTAKVAASDGVAARVPDGPVAKAAAPSWAPRCIARRSGPVGLRAPPAVA